MTDTPEDRAHALWVEIEETHTSQAKVALISQALRQAEDAAYERAAAAAAQTYDVERYGAIGTGSTFNHGVKAAVLAVRSLKSEQGA